MNFQSRGGYLINPREKERSFLFSFFSFLFFSFLFFFPTVTFFFFFFVYAVHNPEYGVVVNPNEVKVPRLYAAAESSFLYLAETSSPHSLAPPFKSAMFPYVVQHGEAASRPSLLSLDRKEVSSLKETGNPRSPPACHH